MTGVALNSADEITFWLMGDDSIEVTATNSDRFAESFYAFVIDVPASVLEQYEQGSLVKFTRWTSVYVHGERRVYDEPGCEKCVNCGDLLPVGANQDDSSTGSPDGDSEVAPPPMVEPTNEYDELVGPMATDRQASRRLCRAPLDADRSCGF